jgi:hypothetical protein
MANMKHRSADNDRLRNIAAHFAATIKIDQVLYGGGVDFSVDPQGRTISE